MQGIGLGNEWASTEKTLVLNKTYYTLPKIKLATLILLRKIKTKSWLISKLKQNRFFGIKINKFIWPVSLNKHRRHKKHRCHYLLRRLPQILSWVNRDVAAPCHAFSVCRHSGAVRKSEGCPSRYRKLSRRNKHARSPYVSSGAERNKNRDNLRRSPLEVIAKKINKCDKYLNKKIL